MVKTSSYANGYSHDQNQHNGYDLVDEIGDQHLATSVDTPMREDAFDKSDQEKMDIIEQHFAEIMHALGLDLTDESLRGTPRRVAKMFVREIFSGLNPANKPTISLFENKFGYRQMLVEKGIRIQSFCEHHFLPIQGVVHIGYIANGQVIGLSKLNRITEHFSRRPQVQERLTMQIAEELKKVLGTEDVAVYIEARHACVEMRGVEHHDCTTVTTEYGGQFLNENTRSEFLQSIKS